MSTDKKDISLKFEFIQMEVDILSLCNFKWNLGVDNKNFNVYTTKNHKSIHTVSKHTLLMPMPSEEEFTKNLFRKVIESYLQWQDLRCN